MIVRISEGQNKFCNIIPDDRKTKTSDGFAYEEPVGAKEECFYLGFGEMERKKTVDISQVTSQSREYRIRFYQENI